MPTTPRSQGASDMTSNPRKPWILGLSLALLACTKDSAGPTDNSTPNPAVDASGADSSKTALSSIHTVFLILFENHNWVGQIKGNPSAPYLNGVLLSAGAHAEEYYNPPNLHPSEPNYIWLEAGDSLGVVDDNGPALNAKDVPRHLATYLEHAGISWKAYEEDIDGH